MTGAELEDQRAALVALAGRLAAHAERAGSFGERRLAEDLRDAARVVGGMAPILEVVVGEGVTAGKSVLCPPLCVPCTLSMQTSGEASIHEGETIM